VIGTNSHATEFIKLKTNTWKNESGNPIDDKSQNYKSLLSQHKTIGIGI